MLSAKRHVRTYAVCVPSFHTRDQSHCLLGSCALLHKRSVWPCVLCLNGFPPSHHGIALHRFFSQCGNNTCDPTGDQSPTLAVRSNLVATTDMTTLLPHLARPRSEGGLAAAAFKQAPLQRQVAPLLCRQQLPEHCAVSWHNRSIAQRVATSGSCCIAGTLSRFGKAAVTASLGSCRSTVGYI